MNDLRGKIGHQFYIALERLGAPMELLACAGSYGDTLEDEDILGLLEDFNARVPRGDRPGEDVANGEPRSIPRGHVRENDFFLTHAIWCNGYGSHQAETGVRSVRDGEVCDDFRLIEHGVTDFGLATPIILHGLRKGWDTHRIGEVAWRIYARKVRRESVARVMEKFDGLIRNLSPKTTSDAVQPRSEK